MSAKGRKSKRGWSGDPRHRRTSFGRERRGDQLHPFFAACKEVVEREAPPLPPYELPEESKEKGAAFPVTDTGNSCEGSEPFEYKVLYERDLSDGDQQTVPTTAFVQSHGHWERSMFLVLLIGMLISIFGWIGTYVVFRKVLWSSTQETIELRERLRQYEPEEPKS